MAFWVLFGALGSGLAFLEVEVEFWLAFPALDLVVGRVWNQKQAVRKQGGHKSQT